MMATMSGARRIGFSHITEVMAAWNDIRDDADPGPAPAQSRLGIHTRQRP